MNESDWATLGATFLGAIVGGGFVIWGTKRTLSSAAEAVNEDRAEQQRVADGQYQRELCAIQRSRTPVPGSLSGGRRDGLVESLCRSIPLERLALMSV
jgi:hypothetical protein